MVSVLEKNGHRAVPVPDRTAFQRKLAMDPSPDVVLVEYTPAIVDALRTSPFVPVVFVVDPELVPPRLPEEIMERAFGLVPRVPGFEAILPATVETALHHAHRETRQQDEEASFRFFFENIPIAAIVSNPDFIIQQWNLSAAELFGYTRDEAVGRELVALLASEKNEYSSQHLKSTLLHTLQANRKSQNTNYDRTRDGRDILCQWHDFPYRKGGRDLILSVATDITKERALLDELQSAVEQKDFLLREIHHRLKNNLNMIGSLISLKVGEIEAGKFTIDPASPSDPPSPGGFSPPDDPPSPGGFSPPDDPPSPGDFSPPDDPPSPAAPSPRLAVDALEDIRHKISAFSVLYDMLYRHDGSARSLDIGGYLEELVATVFSGMTDEPCRVTSKMDTLEADVQPAVVLGLITNEIATNALKHGFEAGGERVFSVSLRVLDDIDAAGDGGARAGDGGADAPAGGAPAGDGGARADAPAPVCEIILENTGKPFPEDVDFFQSASLGLQLIQTLVDQLQGTVELRKRPSARYTLRLPLTYKAGVLRL